MSRTREEKSFWANPSSSTSSKLLKPAAILITALLLSSVIHIQTANAQVTFGYAFGSYGMGMGQFYLPLGVGLGYGRIHVADTMNNRIDVFDSGGHFLFLFGTKGWGYEQFDYPSGVAVDSEGSMYVADTNNNRIQVYNRVGNLMFKFGSYGSGNGQFIKPNGVAVGNGRIYVADSGDWDVSNNRIQVFDLSGNFLFTFGSYGSGDGQFDYPTGVAVDSAGKIYVADFNSRIQVFDSSGHFLRKIGTLGIGDGQLRAPFGVAVGSTGNVYVSDTQNSRIQVFDSSGNFLFKYGISGSGNGQFSIPNGIAVDSTGKIYVADTGNYRIQVLYPVAAAPEPYTFLGFAPPVDNPPASNTVKAGSTVPVKFSLDGYYGMDVQETGYPGSQEVACDSLNPVDIVEGAVTAGSKGLSYDESTDQYTYAWKTKKAWAGSCRQLIVKLSDGTEHIAYFEFR